MLSAGLIPESLPNRQAHIQFRVARPAGVLVIAILFLAVCVYLCGIGAAMLIRPGLVSIALGAPLLFGLELAGPYMFLLLGAVGGLIGWGLLRTNRWARRAAALVALLGVVLLVPRVSGDLIAMQFENLAVGGFQIIVRVIVAWYLYQGPVVKIFEHQ
jgi:hypothetical protein